MFCVSVVRHEEEKLLLTISWVDTFSLENRRHWIARSYSLRVITALCGPGLNNASVFVDSLILTAPGNLFWRSSLPPPPFRPPFDSGTPWSSYERAMASNNNRYSEGSYTTVACNSCIQGREKFEEILIALIPPNYNLRKVLIAEIPRTISHVTSVLRSHYIALLPTYT